MIMTANDNRGPCGCKSSDICLKVRKTPEKTSPRKLVPNGDRTRARFVIGTHATACSTVLDITQIITRQIILSLKEVLKDVAPSTCIKLVVIFEVKWTVYRMYLDRIMFCVRPQNLHFSVKLDILTKAHLENVKIILC